MDNDKNLKEGSKKIDANFMQDIDFDKLMGFSDFGKKRVILKNYKQVIEESKVEAIKPSRSISKPANTVFENAKSMESSSKSSESEKEIPEDEIDYAKNPELRVPCSNSLLIPHGNRLVSSVCIDNSGSRLISTSHDFMFNMYDFATMDSYMKPFRTFDPLEYHHLKCAKFNPSGDKILLTGYCAEMKILDRDGKTVKEVMKGDQYIVDMGVTKGHVAPINSASWNPLDMDCFVTSGEDSTIRIWSAEASDAGNKRVIKVKTSQGKNLIPVDCIYNYSGTTIYASCIDGSLRVWDPKRATALPSLVVQNAHTLGSPAYSLVMHRNDYYLASRGMDDSLKLWDIRKFKEPVHSITQLPNSHDSTRVIFSPDNRLLITGTSERKGEKNSFLNFYRVQDMSLALSIPFENASPIAPFWHPKINQLFVACSDGNIRAFFHPQKSRNGVLLCMTKIHQHKIDVGESLIADQVITPYSKQEGFDKNSITVVKFHVKTRRDPILTKKPEPPVYGPGQGGRLTNNLSLSAFICRQMLVSGPSIEDNPRDEILKFAKLAEEDPYFVTPAYAQTQPKQIFRESESEDEEDPAKIKKT